MFRKVMQISDELMWRYYELLTDKSLTEIAAMRQTMHPMEAKIALGKLIVADFHTAEDAECAAEIFNRVVRQREVPSDIVTMPLPGDVGDGAFIRVDKLLHRTGLADSVSDGARKIKAGAVEINGERTKDLVVIMASSEWLIRVGKNWRRVKK
jgi:tyrosyl-tRNA synthetase